MDLPRLVGPLVGCLAQTDFGSVRSGTTGNSRSSSQAFFWFGQFWPGQPSRPSFQTGLSSRTSRPTFQVNRQLSNRGTTLDDLWREFWWSWRQRTDLDDSFTFLSGFMDWCWCDFWCSWRERADFDDSYTVLSDFKDGLEPPNGEGSFCPLNFTPQNGHQKLSKNSNFWGNFLDHFLLIFSVHFGVQNLPKMSQDGIQKPSWGVMEA